MRAGHSLNGCSVQKIKGHWLKNEQGKSAIPDYTPLNLGLLRVGGTGVKGKSLPQNHSLGCGIAEGGRAGTVDVAGIMTPNQRKRSGKAIRIVFRERLEHEFHQ